jgi:hypothetical protein
LSSSLEIADFVAHRRANLIGTSMSVVLILAS